jgi:hypothetical protein
MISHVGRRAVAAKAAAAPNIPLTGFAEIKHAVATQWQRMSTHELFRTGAEKDAMWACYLESFPEGTNPIFRKRTEHDCSCCRQFVRAVGNVVAIIDGELVSIWDIPATTSNGYQAVAAAMSALVKSSPIDNRFLHTEGVAGTDRNFEEAIEGVKAWDHFFVHIPNSRIARGVDIGPKLSESRALHDVLLRSLTELTMDAVGTTLELIGQNSLYRGEEHRHAIAAFRQAKVEFDRLDPAARDGFVWLKTCELPASVSKIRNTSIGQLLTDLSEGREMEDAVKSFEAMVAPANYKRPTALVTPAMVVKAKATVEELGLTSALERRYATLPDIAVNNVLFADRNARKAMSGSVFDDIASATPIKAKAFDKVEEIGIEKFLADVLPNATTLELLVENRHAGNLVSLIAPADPTAQLLFKWDNRFSWSYAGDFADSVKERVKRAGGNVTGDLCCRLGWYNHDDLDFHMREPGRYEIFYGVRGRMSPCGGDLDVDMNAGFGRTREPVENIYYGSASRMREGDYHLFVYQYCKRDAKDVGFEAEIDFLGTVWRFSYDRPMRTGESVTVAHLRYTKAKGVELLTALPHTTASKKVWGIDTETFQKVNVAMLSPNHWDGHGVGNRHYFFMLDGCMNDGTARGFYNEFLKGELDPHRKVFELVGARMRAEETPSQLSGLGFSSTQRNHVIARVTGAFSRAVRINF